LKKAIYKPTNQNTIIINQLDDYCEILLDNEYKMVSVNDLIFESSQITLSTLEQLKENILINCIKHPLSDILYSYNTNRLTPEPHQYKPLIKFLNSENSRVLIADEVGLGKTIEAGMIFKEIDRREALKVSLIVVPSSLTLKWQEEFAIRFDEHFEIYNSSRFLNFIDEFDNFNSSKLLNEKIIISYHTLRDKRVMKKLENSFFEIDFLIMDEAHTMRNYDTSTFKSAKIITAISEHILFLTATPVQNSLEDLFNILSLLDNDYFKDFDYFQKMIKPNATIHKLISLIRNNHDLETIQDFVNNNIENSYPKELKEIFRDIIKLKEIPHHKKIELIDRLTQSDHLSFIINRSKKKDVGRSIPRSATSLIVEITQAEQEYYNAVIDFVKFLNPTTPQGFITIMPERMASSSMIASLESFKEIKKSGNIFLKDIDDLEEYHESLEIQKEAMSYLDNIIQKGNLIGADDSKFIKFEEILKELKSQKIKQMIVFSFFKKTLDYLERKLEKLDYSVGKIHGDFSIEERFSKIKAFKRGEFDILLSSEVGSEGLDMQFCNVVINYDLPWNPMRVEQRIGRIDRIGQKFDKLHIFNLCIVGSIEDRIYNRLYSKLGIFENSIGELEPILGDLEKQLNISKLIHLSAEELDKQIHLQELALEREKSEIKMKNSEVEKLINDDFNHQTKAELFLNQNKVSFLQEESKRIFVKFLEGNSIGFLELKDGTIKISSENLKRLLKLLKTNMSNKRTNALAYKEERRVLQKINRLKELKVSFQTNNNDEFQTLYLYLNHPIIAMIIRDKNYKSVYSVVSHKDYSSGFAIIYRVDFKQLKVKSMIRVIVVDKNLALVEELDYFEFISKCSEAKAKSSINLEELKAKLNLKVIQFIEQHKQIESKSQNRLIDIKINSMQNYFEKQINKVKRLQKKVQQEDIVRMRIGEIENLENRRDEKIRELMGQKEISFGFEILGVLEIGGDYE
jgi:SNF2 family DNA or RNA helicase